MRQPKTKALAAQYRSRQRDLPTNLSTEKKLLWPTTVALDCAAASSLHSNMQNSIYFTSESHRRASFPCIYLYLLVRYFFRMPVAYAHASLPPSHARISACFTCVRTTRSCRAAFSARLYAKQYNNRSNGALVASPPLTAHPPETRAIT